MSVICIEWRHGKENLSGFRQIEKRAAPKKKSLCCRQVTPRGLTEKEKGSRVTQPTSSRRGSRDEKKTFRERQRRKRRDKKAVFSTKDESKETENRRTQST